MKIAINNLFPNRDSLVKKFIEDESFPLYEALEDLEDKRLKLFSTEILCATVEMSYDFFCGLHLPSNIFYRNIRLLDQEKSRKIFRWLSMYHVIRLKKDNPNIPPGLASYTARLFGWGSRDWGSYYYYSHLFSKSPAQFDVEMSRAMASNVFGQMFLGPLNIAFIGNLFYNSHKDILNAVGVG